MATDDSMSDDVFEDDTLRAPAHTAQRSTPSPTGYRDYHPPVTTPARMQDDDDVIIHKTILLGDSGVGKTSLLVQFETGKFQAGNFSATVGIGFTLSARILSSDLHLRRSDLLAKNQSRVTTMTRCTAGQSLL
ncbi:hypothetical protein B5X24_HaOG209595 [Helicoverpa armigera]|nr:hypothetical protein B5X24_HaOG209595 [Helicoverpa armigera]